MMRQRHSFTLLEIVIALGIFGFIMLTGAMILNSSVKLNRKNAAVATSVRIEHNLSQLLERDLSACHAYDSDYTNVLLIKNDTGDSSELYMLTCKDSFERIGYFLVPNRENPDYQMLVRAHEDGRSNDIEVRKNAYILYDKVTSFSVLGLDGDEWKESWKSAAANGPPSAVRISFSGVYGDGPTDDSGKAPSEQKISFRKTVIIPVGMEY